MITYVTISDQTGTVIMTTSHFVRKCISGTLIPEHISMLQGIDCDGAQTLCNQLLQVSRTSVGRRSLGLQTRLQILQYARLDPAYQSYSFVQEVIHQACSYGCLEIAQWAWSLGEEMNMFHTSSRVTRYLWSAYTLTNMAVAEWLWSILVSMRPPNELLKIRHELFVNACHKQIMKAVEWVWDLDEPLDVSTNDYRCLFQTSSVKSSAIVEFLIEHTQNDPKIRYLSYGDNYCYVLNCNVHQEQHDSCQRPLKICHSSMESNGISDECVHHTHHFDGIEVWSRAPITRGAAHAVLDSIARKKSARSATEAIVQDAME